MFNELIFLASCLMVVFFVYATQRFLKAEGLITWIALSAVLANLFVQKQITLFGLNATASDIYAVGSFLGLNVLQKHYGYKMAQKSILISFAGLAFFCWAAQMHLTYQASAFDVTQTNYVALLQPIPRLLFASIVAYFISQQTNAGLFYILDKISPQHFSRNQLFSLLVSQLFDTLIFAYIGLFGMVQSLNEIIIISYLIKAISIITMTLLLSPFFGKKNEV